MNEGGRADGGTAHGRRNQAIETLRLLAVFGVVAFHSPVPGKEVAYAGLPAFVLLSSMLDTQYNWERRRSLRVLAKTLLVPWLFWLLVYAGVKIVDGKQILNLKDGVLSALLVGTAPHLWFLPFIFTALGLTNLIKGRMSERTLLLAAVALATALLVSAGWWRTFHLGLPWGRWLHASPLFVAGLAFGLTTRVPKGFVLVLPVLAGIGFVGFQGIPGVSVSYVVGTAAVLLASWLGSKLPASFDVESLSRCVMGVYLAHVAWLVVLWPLLVRFRFPAVIGAFLVTLGSVWVVRKYLPASRTVL